MRGLFYGGGLRPLRMAIAISFICQVARGQAVVKEYADSVVMGSGHMRVVLHVGSGTVDYAMGDGLELSNTVAYVRDLRVGALCSAEMGVHAYSTERVRDSLGEGLQMNIKHFTEGREPWLMQRIVLYEHGISVSLEAGPNIETRHISPVAVLPVWKGKIVVGGQALRILDEPFDNDEWVGMAERSWPAASGISYEFSSIYDNARKQGLVMGSLEHSVWKTGIDYGGDSLVVYGGAATREKDGTHDHMPHGTVIGETVHSPLVWLGGGDVRTAFRGYGEANARLNGSLSWKGAAPFYWNSFGVEGVLGYTKIMMPPGVGKISDFLSGLDQFNRYARPVLSIDSYDQSIYTTELLASLGKYGQKHHQQVGFYFIPFAIWAWKNNMEGTKIPGTDYLLKDVVLRDADDKPIAYKDGDWGAFPIDPTHPAVRQTIITQLLKAKAIDARFIKIDFLTAGALESSKRWDPGVRTGMQAYDRGMRMLKHLIDSILGPDIFITEAISPMFPHQYAHTRFISTDVYSHLRDDQTGFPSWGSTEASLATGSHLGWVQGTLWPYTNLDVVVMQRFQQNPVLTENEVKVRLYAMMVMGSILGDGSDLRQPEAAARARKFLNHPAICSWFSHPKAFEPLEWADGGSLDQRMVFYERGERLLALFNFSNKDVYEKGVSLGELGLTPGRYELRDFLTDAVVGRNEGEVFRLSVPVRDAILLKILSIQ